MKRPRSWSRVSAVGAMVSDPRLRPRPGYGVSARECASAVLGCVGEARLEYESIPRYDNREPKILVSFFVSTEYVSKVKGRFSSSACINLNSRLGD